MSKSSQQSSYLKFCAIFPYKLFYIIQISNYLTMQNSRKSLKLVLLDPNQNNKAKPKVSFDQAELPATKKSTANLGDIRQMKSSERQRSNRRRRSTFHYNITENDEIIQRKTYKFSQTVKKTTKTSRFRHLWISKRGTRNFYIMENQDFVLIDQKNKDYRLYGILDGHGKYGRLLAETVGTKLPSKYAIDQKTVQKQNMQQNNEKIMKNSIIETNKFICQNMAKQVTNSGCTLLSILIRDNKIYCFNVGGSRAIMVVKDKDGQKLMPFPLSSDQNLSRFDEKSRIMQTKAILQQLKDESGCRIGPERIWRKNQKYPGIYITRSLGMKMSMDLGIIAEPQSICVQIQPNYVLILVCSDGFWEVFTNEEAIEYITKYWRSQKLEEGIQILMDQAVRRWDKKSQLMDDISILVIKI